MLLPRTASAIGSLPQRPETTEKGHPVPENSEANGAARGPAPDPDQGSHGADPKTPGTLRYPKIIFGSERD
ncbi:hypothetical protein MDA_GLEAN10006764 [Myotis davidii]|uniref:Uncharacterized protein n=1 Tax=Myotis davidii TaxID=225400 RepID=L5LIN3_MYODS|nr:hypothetical protein MDA_GLEAN10006764 [Myotis davidii]